MKKFFWLDLLSAALYVFFGAILSAYNVSALKTVVITVGITLVFSAGALFLFCSRDSSSAIVCAALAALGALLAVFSQFFVNLSLFLCGAIIAVWGFVKFSGWGKISFLIDVAIGVFLIISVFILKKFLLLVISVLMIAGAALRILSLAGILDA